MTNKQIIIISMATALLIDNSAWSCFMSTPRHSRNGLRHLRKSIIRYSQEDVLRGTDSLWSEDIRDEAANALLPVLFPIVSAKDCQKPITAEVALKKLLRSRYQSSIRVQSHHTHFAINISRQLATLVLGTSVMRLRHWYVVLAAQDDGSENMSPIPYPMNASILNLIKTGTNILVDSSPGDSNEEFLPFVKAMVDEHIKFLLATNLSLPALEKIENQVVKLSLEYSVPIFITEALVKQYSYSTTKDIFIQSNAPGPVTIRKNSIRFTGSDEQLCEYLMDEDGVHASSFRSVQSDSKFVLYSSSNGKNQFTVESDAEPGTIAAPSSCLRIIQSKDSSNNTTNKLPKSIWSMKGWSQGYFEVQDAGSQIILHSLEPRPGDSVFDYCAGNGGKTFGVASLLMERTRSQKRSASNEVSNFASTVVAHDVVEERLRQIKGSMSRVGFTKDDNDLSSFTATDNGGGTCNICIATSMDLESMKSSKFDIVLVDAPCSSTGVLRRRPTQRWSLIEEEVFVNLPRLQLEILKKAAGFVKSGGKLVYSTCSLLNEENQDVVFAFEESDLYYDAFERWDFSVDDRTVGDVNIQNMLTILPSANSDGFFIARWKAK